MSTVPGAVDIRQVSGESPQVLTEILQEGVNLAVWQRRLPAQVEDFSTVLASLGQLLSDERIIDVDEDAPVELPGLLAEAADLHGYEAFVADVCWLVAAFTCLVGARRIGLRLRVLDGAMCPRFHVDKVTLRLLTTFAGVGSEWLREAECDRADLQRMKPDVDKIQRLSTGDVAILKGERWTEGAGVIHRSPMTAAGERRLLLSLDWLA
ncbi:DUF1826 domain-containing protein [Pseudomonas hunanensis]|uniref:DUF1826 domain-containing protein n=1 Tax=Pseudomonas hunanensis TaxID=1247546 RepID=UPI00286D2BF5|nr:DUF1826 domain-containing protein [Pseudomonas hunanensis]